ncbi:MAG TPA: hypothetical protein PKD27_02430 [Tepidiformaceae bacterium]|nr:hypothetical protein [Tepidiformaceae bacterium]
MSLELAWVDPNFGQDYRIISPSVVGNRMADLDRQVTRLNDIIGSGDITGRIADFPNGTEFIRAWAAFVGEWRVFYRENSDWLSRFTSGVVREAERFAARFNDFELRFNGFRLNVETGLPARNIVEPGAGRTMLLWVGLGVVGLFGAAWLIREGRGAVREARDFLPEREPRRRVQLDPGLGPAPPTIRLR